MRTDAHVELSKKGRRKLTPFFAHEMLGDVLRGDLDEERKIAFERTLKEEPELRAELERLRAGLDYAQKLSLTVVASGVLERIDEPETYLSVLLKKTNYERWPLTVKWGLEAAVVLSIFMTVLIAIPWDRALKFGLSPRGREIILAEVQHPQPVTDATDGNLVTEERKPEPPAPAEKPVAATAKVPAPPVPAPPETPSPKPATSAAPAAAVATALAVKPQPTEGVLYRGTLTIDSLQANGAEITEKIVALGARKAGEVELGWRKTPTSAYYHFTMPEGNYEELVKFLKEQGAPKISKERHPRILPAGLIRMILTVDEGRR